MKKLKTNRWFKNFIILFVFLLIVEILFKLCGSIRLFDYSLIRIVISTSFLALIFSFILSFINKIASMVINILLVFIASVYSMAQIGFENFLGVYMSLGTSSQFGAVVDYIGEYLASFHLYYWLMLIPCILIIIYYIFFDRKLFKELPKLKKEYRLKNFLKKLGILAVTLIVLNCLYSVTLNVKFMQNKLQSVSNKELIKDLSVPSIAIKQFGPVVFGIVDVKNYIFPTDVEILEYTFKKSENLKTDYSREIDDTAWESVIANETNSIYRNLNNYFISQEITPKNDYTGMFEGKNLIVIMMESVGELMINPEYFPNFSKMYNEGWAWTNSYSPRNSCATGNNEMSGMVSLYTIYNSCTANNYKNNKYFESIFNIFNRSNYQTNSMHDYDDTYYQRRTIHPNMGSSKYYDVQNLGISYGREYKEWASDAEFMEKYLEILDETSDGRPFMSWLTTVTSHQPYSSSTHGDMYLDLYKDTNLPIEIKRYYSKMKVLDEGFGILLEGLEKRGILDDTVIVLYGDHYPYGISKNTLSKVIDYDLSDYEAERTPFVIYNSKMTPKKFSDYTFYMNILPTVANLFGVSYDPRLYMGSDLLSPDYKSLVVFADGSWKNEIAYYNASTGAIKYFDDTRYTNEEITEINNTITLKMKISTQAIRNNYFNYLENSLDKYKEEQTIE